MKLATRLIVEEALEAESRDALGRDYYELALATMVPAHVDVLITHGPPHFVLDRTETGENIGCEELPCCDTVHVPAASRLRTHSPRPWVAAPWVLLSTLC